MSERTRVLTRDADRPGVTALAERKHVNIVDLFAGPGGWDEGLRMLGRTDVAGIEWDHDACLTATAAGHLRIEADVANYPTAPFAGIEGLIASPPCTAFSMAGKGEGRDVMAELLEAVHNRDWTALRSDYDPTVWLPLEVGRWVEELRPEWVAFEQVPQALPIWEAYVHVLEAWGYAADARVLMAADFGVPQTRQRAFLIAHRDGVRWPEPTHFGNRRRKHQMDLFGSPWVTAADAVGWEDYEIDRRTNSKDGRGGMVPTVPVPTDRPAPTVTGKAGSQWKRRPRWVYERPACTIIGTRRLSAPGHRCMSEDCCGRGPQRHFGDDAVDVELWELGVLQSFPADYPWQGNKTSQDQQVGNAVPPLLVAHVLRALLADSTRERIPDTGGDQ